MDIGKTLREWQRVRRDRKTVFTPQANDVHLEAAMQWLKRAQDATADSGVAQTYLTKYKKWANSYPETTGYIIPTFYRYYQLTGDEEYRKRAIAMADWECDIQLPEGGVLAGALGDSDKPTVFNTGQVLFGWVTAYEQEKQQRYLDSAVKAADWLCSIMDDDGCWRKFGSPMTLNDGINLYNTRSAWGLARVYQASGNEKYLQYAVKNAEWGLTQCDDNGFGHNNCLQDASQPFLHTIAYAMRGFLEIGVIAKRQDFIAQAIKMGDAMRLQVQKDGFIAGRFNQQWLPTVKWSCLTGNAQISINWCRLAQVTGDMQYLAAAESVMHYTKTTQILSDFNDNVRGGIKGSHPINGGYHPWQYPNWATKFFADALMIIDTLKAGKGPYQHWPV